MLRQELRSVAKLVGKFPVPEHGRAWLGLLWPMEKPDSGHNASLRIITSLFTRGL